jgi:phage gp45-like
MMEKLKRMLGWASITKSSDNSGNYPIQQVTYMGKIADAVALMPYGIHSNIPADTLAVIASINAQSENRVIMGVAPPNRPTLEPGEVALYHPDSGSMVRMKSDGSISVIGDLTVTGDITASGDVTATDITASGDVLAGSIDLVTHTHIGSPTAATGPVSNTGVPV